MFSECASFPYHINSIGFLVSEAGSMAVLICCHIPVYNTRYSIRIRIAMSDAEPEPDPEWHKKKCHPHADPTSRFTHVGKLLQKVFLVTALPQYDVSFSSVSNVS
jgi:hypothetical protein